MTRIRNLLLTSAVLLSGLAPTAGAATAQPERPAAHATIVLVHGAFADSSSWNGVASRLAAKGYPVVAAANPLRGVRADADYVSRIIRSVEGPVVLVGHSYGGEVISTAANGNANVKALVYVAAFAPDQGESAASLSSKFEGGTLGAALGAPVAQADGSKDLYIRQDKFHDQFAADVSPAEASLMAAAQRPIADAALAEPNGAPAWKSLPSWFVYGTLDRNIPAAAQAFMASRARARKTVVVEGGSHVVMISQPDIVASLIEEAAAVSR